MLIATNLAKRYRGRTVVQGMSMQVDTGEIVGLLGPNGAGKTTCFYMIVGLVAADGGTIELDGQDITRASMHRRSHAGLGYLPQEASIFRRLSVADNIMAALQLRRDLGRRQRQRELTRLMEEFAVGHLARQPGQFALSLAAIQVAAQLQG